MTSPGLALNRLLTHDERGEKRDWYLVACQVACQLQGHVESSDRRRTKNGRTWFFCSRCEEWIADEV